MPRQDRMRRSGFEFMLHLFNITDWLFTLVTHGAVVLGLATILRHRRLVEDHTPLLAFVTWPLLILGLVKLYAFGMEWFITYYSGSQYESDAMTLRFTGPYGLWYGLQILALAMTQVFWSLRFRRSSVVVLIVGIFNLAN